MRWWLLSVVVGAGCVEPAPTHTAAEAARDDFYGDAYPALEEATCTACHAGPSHAALDFLGGPDPYETITTSQMFSSYSNATGSLLVIGGHEGPALTANEFERIQAWLDLEADAERWGPTLGAKM
ncbi:MAG TPA: hypothetical protein VGF94_01610 [Kofleriaceae bacterium]|jgi:mono/diheme cytochrome c family protein